jgi:hypothetical protein
MIDDEYDESALFSAPQSTPKSEVGNPLASYFRLPGLSVSLPTSGVFMPEGSIEFNDDGTVNVMPMRGADEILLMSPDALMNNTAITNLIKSCVPQIKKPEFVSVPDLDVLLLAIRVASTGPDMEINLICEKCSHETTFEINIPEMIQTAKSIDPINTVRVRDDMIAQVAPLTLQNHNKLLTEVFRETRAAQALEFAEDLSEEEKSEKINTIMNNITRTTLYGTSCAVVKITVPDAEVTNPTHIAEFLEKTDSKTMKKIKQKVDEVNQKGVDKSFQAQCGGCGHEWNAEVEFDPSSFFGTRSSD